MTNSTLRVNVTQVRGSHLIVEPIGDDIVVYNRRTHVAHLLDPRAAFVWRAAKDGCALADVVALMDGKTAAERKSVAELAIADLQAAGLLICDAPMPPRRSALKALGHAVALPMVVSILAPSPAAAASNLAPGAACTQGTDFCKTPVSSKAFLCQDPIPPNNTVNGGRCCWDQVTRTNVKLAGEACVDFKDCCSFTDCVGGFCLVDF